MCSPFSNRPVEVLFSRRAHAAICAETLEHHPLETGGILLGHCHQQRWQVLEAIDPGPAARCTATTFEYDHGYVNHLARKLAAQYQRPLQLIGLWHRHPGSFDQFSPEDDSTNRRFAATSPHGALSCLVNLDPGFRLTAFHVPSDLSYQKLPVVIGDALIESALRAPLCAADLTGERLGEAALERDMQQLFARQPRACAPLKRWLVQALDSLLRQLDQQRRWRYGLRACGHHLQLGLIETQGAGRELWELALGCHQHLMAQRHDGMRLPAAHFNRYLMDGTHGR